MYSHNSSAVLVDGVALPSVTKILASDPKKVSYYKSLGLKRKTTNYDGAGIAVGRHRGISLHSSFNQYLLHGDADIAPCYYKHWDNLYNLVKDWDFTPVWSEAPLLEEHSQFKQGDVSIIYSKKYSYLGNPDFIGGLGGVPIIAELKTGSDVMTKNYDSRRFQTYSQWMPYYSAATQVSSYAQAWKECTKQDITTGVVINVTENDAQFFVVDQPEMSSRFKSFRKLARNYHNAH